MAESADNQWIPLEPRFGRSRKSRELFLGYAHVLRQLANRCSKGTEYREKRKNFLALQQKTRREHWPALAASGLLLSDLAEQGWGIRIRSGQVEVQQSAIVEVDVEREKTIIRRQELIKRDAQLAKETVRQFIQSMEQRRMFRDEFVSIFSLMRNGKELASQLSRIARKSSNGNGQTLFEAIDPYIEFVNDRVCCQFTGMRLKDIWRYFRYTWTNQYTNVPGRTMMLIIRDAAAEYHPIIGIAAISSPIMQLRKRDQWIGWDPDSILEDIRSRPNTSIAKWLVEIVHVGVKELYIADFISDGVLTRYSLEHPNEEIIKRLMKEGKYHRDAHHRFSRSNDHAELKRTENASPGVWKKMARTHLFRSKRAYSLASLLQARTVLNKIFGDQPTGSKLAKLIETSAGQKAVRIIAKKAKADRVGVAMADISVCGAVAPYNILLGGKLVSMLATSPEVVREYQRRYGNAESRIASSMAGRPIIRPANLVYLGTTSLYGTHSSQYNRINIPGECVGSISGADIRFHRLGKSEAFGTSQFSDETVQALVSLVQHSKGGQRVNSIFGEGASPKLRKVKEGLEVLGLPSDRLLKHGRNRIVYGVPLVTNAMKYLLGRDKRPRYIISKGARDATKNISEWWAARWLQRRIQNHSVLANVATHTMVHPISHGARVFLVQRNESEDTFGTELHSYHE